MSLDEYLAFEETVNDRHEYVAGDVYAMTGATLRHVLIVQNLLIRLAERTRCGPCRAYTHDVKVRVGDDRVYYPDLLVQCGSLPGDTLVVSDPCVIIEVTSPSSARIDRGEKLDAYRRLPSLQAYLVVDQRRRRVDWHWRDSAGGVWRSDEYIVDGNVPIPCIDTSLTVDEIYEGVELPSVSEPELAEYEV